jgi:low affinity Fe/Cu permease
MKKQIIFLMPVFLLFVLCQNSNKKAEAIQVFPSDTISMQYSHQFPRFCLPVLDGIVNDSLHFDVFFDTGSGGNYFCIPESFKNLFDSDSAFLQIGKLKKQMGIHYWGSNQLGIIDIIGKNTIMVGWNFFENKIIELDFQNQHILVYDELPDITEYSKTKIILSYNTLLIPAQVVIQGKTLQDTFNIDTGCNEFVVLNKKHIEEQGIDTKNASYGKSTVSGGVRFGFAIPADTIKIGDLNVANQNMHITFNNYKGGLLGTQTLENFSVILDLINYDLYLKKNKN